MKITTELLLLTKICVGIEIYITSKDELISISEKHIGFYSKAPMVTDIQEISIDK